VTLWVVLLVSCAHCLKRRLRNCCKVHPTAVWCTLWGTLLASWKRSCIRWHRRRMSAEFSSWAFPSATPNTRTSLPMCALSLLCIIPTLTAKDESVSICSRCRQRFVLSFSSCFFVFLLFFIDRDAGLLLMGLHLFWPGFKFCLRNPILMIP
jgi:hypothetical protein